MQTRCGTALVVAAAAVVLGAVRYLPVIDAPWDRSMATINATEYMAPIVRSWQRLGFRELAGEPCLVALPTEPAIYKQPYHNHPAGYPWALYAVVDRAGFTERGFRLLPVCCAVLAAALLAFLVTRRAGVAWGSAAAAIHLACPMAFFFGWMPNPESAALLGILAVFGAWEVARDRGVLARLVVVLLFAAVAWIDWQAYFAAPAVWFAEVLRRAEERRLARSLLLFPAGVVSFLAHNGLVGWWLSRTSGDGWWDGFTTALDRSVGAAGSKAIAEEGQSVRAWLTHQGTFWSELYGWPLALLAGVGVLWLLVRARDPLARLGLAMLVPAVLNVAAFRETAFDHEFWWYYAVAYAPIAAVVVLRDLARKPAAAVTGGIALLGAAVAQGPVMQGALNVTDAAVAGGALGLGWGLARWRGASPVVGAVILLVAFGGLLGDHRWSEWRNDELRDGARSLYAEFDQNDLVLRALPFGAEGFYLDAWHADRLTDPAMLQALKAFKDADSIRVDRVYYWFPDSIAPYHPEVVALLPKLGRLERRHNQWTVLVID